MKLIYKEPMRDDIVSEREIDLSTIRIRYDDNTEFSLEDWILETQKRILELENLNGI